MRNSVFLLWNCTAASHSSSSYSRNACSWVTRLTTNAYMPLYSPRVDSRQGQGSILFPFLSLSAFVALAIPWSHTHDGCKEWAALFTLSPVLLGHCTRAYNGSKPGLLFPLGDCKKLFEDTFIPNSIPQRSRGATLTLLLLM